VIEALFGNPASSVASSCAEKRIFKNGAAASPFSRRWGGQESKIIARFLDRRAGDGAVLR